MQQIKKKEQPKKETIKKKIILKLQTTGEKAFLLLSDRNK